MSECSMPIPILAKLAELLGCMRANQLVSSQLLPEDTWIVPKSKRKGSQWPQFIHSTIVGRA